MDGVKRVVDLPAHGHLFAVTDIQGNLRDFERVVAIFEARQARYGDAYLVVTGDLVHGPELGVDEWPELLGTFYTGDSAGVLDAAEALQRRYPNRVTYLLGNHEHAHVGGPIVGKFFLDEAARLEDILGPERSSDVRAWFRLWPLVAIASQARFSLSHGAPHAPIRNRDEVDALTLDELRDEDDIPTRSILGSLLWARGATRARARAFLRALDPRLRVAVFGHDVVREGFAIEHEPCLCVSSSFGCHDGDKVYLSWELSEPASSARDLARRGLQRLWPDATPIFLDARTIAAQDEP